MNGRGLRAIALSVSAVAGLSSCVLLPGSGPSASAFAPAGSREGASFTVVPVDATVLARSGPDIPPTLQLMSRPVAETGALLRPGDTVSVTIFEADVGGLFSSGGVAGGGSPMTRLPDQTVSADGTLTIPFGGRVAVGGLTTRQAEGRIVAALRGRAIEPQAMVATTASPARSVTVTGDAIAGRQVLVPESGLRVLDAVAAAGGPTRPLAETALRVTRGSQSVQLPLALVASDPAENIALAAGDSVLLTRQPRSVVVLGALGRNAELALSGYDTTLAQILAQAGGLDAVQADAGGVFVMRMVEVEEALAHGGIAAMGKPVAFRFNLREPLGLVHARRFVMREGDVVFTATAPLAELRNALAVFQGIGAPAVSGAAGLSAL